jgi:hypothetical protein
MSAESIGAANLEGVHVMLDLGQLQRKLNSDLKLRQDFFSDPVSTLQKEGLVLSLEQQRELRATVAALGNKKTQGRVSFGVQVMHKF